MIYSYMALHARYQRVKSLGAPRQPIKARSLQAGARPVLTPHWIMGIPEQMQLEIERRATPEAQMPGGRATILERLVYPVLVRYLGTGAVDFYSSLNGGRIEFGFGRQVADFVIEHLRIIVEAQGEFWHFQRGQMARDLDRKMILESLGWTVLFLEEDVIMDPMRLDDWVLTNVVMIGARHEGYIVSSWEGISG